MFYEQTAEKKEKLVPHLSHTQEREHGKGRARTGKMEREKWEREMLGATGYLSCRNGVSYEKTSVNFLSDLQQSLTQSSHSVSLWSCCLTESCHCTQAPLHCSALPTLQHFPLKSDMTGPLQSARQKLGCTFKGQTQTDLGSWEEGEVMIPTAAGALCVATWLGCTELPVQHNWSQFESWSHSKLLHQSNLGTLTSKRIVTQNRNLWDLHKQTTGLY